jgi:tRNA pseudouridine55 synthase
MNGWLLIDKKSGIGSAATVYMVRGLLGTKKIGHLGTLDPLATGILPLAVGEATKLVDIAIQGDKIYEFEVTFGTATDTDDSCGAVIQQSQLIPSVREIEAILPKFMGEIWQIPPNYSAIKVGGKRAYNLAKKGKTVNLLPRKVSVDELSIIYASDDCKKIGMRVRCSKGFYVRSLARDLGETLGSCAHISVLRRLKTGNFWVNDAINVAKLTEIVHNVAPSSELLFPLCKGIPDSVPVLEVDGSGEERIRNGLWVRLSHGDCGLCVVRSSASSRIVALGVCCNGCFNPKRGFCIYD